MMSTPILLQVHCHEPCLKPVTIYHSPAAAGRIWHAVSAHLKGARNGMIGLTFDEIQAEIERRMDQLDEAQEEAEHLGLYGDLLRTAALVGFQRAAELIDANNRRIADQLRSAGIEF
jgi:hypothetical protein